MKLKSMQIKNFRCFSDLTIDFDDRLTVLVGANGSGKTAVLDAVTFFLKKAAGEVFRFDEFDHPLPSYDMRQGESEMLLRIDCKVRGYAEAVTLQYGYRLNGRDEMIASKEAAGLFSNLKLLSDLYHYYGEALSPRDERPLPVLVYYSAKRTLNSYDGPTNEHPGPETSWKKAFEPTIDFSTSFAWFINHANIEAREWKKRGMGEYNQPELSAVRQAIASALSNVDGHADEFDEPYVDDRDKLVICRKSAPDVPLSVEQLSDGYRVMLALVMDLARRMAAANENVKWPEGQTVLHSPAVVLIDEVEKHLHPGWQQTVLPKLMGIFPNAQFIVTTHSPQVLSSISGKHVRVLKGEKVYGLADVDETEGAESSRVLRDVLGISPRPQGNRYTKKLSRYKELAYNEKWDTPEAENLRSELDAHFHDAEPEMDELKLHIENSQWERQLEAEERRSKA